MCLYRELFSFVLLCTFYQLQLCGFGIVNTAAKSIPKLIGDKAKIQDGTVHREIVRLSHIVEP